MVQTNHLLSTTIISGSIAVKYSIAASTINSTESIHPEATILVSLCIY